HRVRVDNSSSPITAAEPTTGSAAVHPPPGSHMNPIASQHSPPPPFHPIHAAFSSLIPFVVQECTVCASTIRPVRSLQPSRPLGAPPSIDRPADAFVQSLRSIRPHLHTCRYMLHPHRSFHSSFKSAPCARRQVVQSDHCSRADHWERRRP